MASRTYALHRARHPRSSRFDLEAGVRDQVYGGASAEAPALRAAVAQTRGEYLSDEKGRPLAALFHSQCGGKTEVAGAVWAGSRKGGASVPCEFCREKAAGWRARFSWQELRSALGWPVGAKVPRLSAGEKLPSGRWKSLGLNGPPGNAELSADELRRRLGYDKLKSALFEWKTDREGVEFSGRGAGHGVGLCQWGARHLAKRGRGYRAILAHYYPEARLQPLKKWWN